MRMKNSPSQSSKVASIQVLRGLAALLVVLYHLRFSEQLMSDAEPLLPSFFKMGAVGVDLFFVISGFIMVTVTEKKIGTPGAAPEFLYSRFSRVFPIYWLFTSAILALGLFKPSLLNVPIGSIWSIVQSYLLIPQGTFPILKVGWTLIHELYFYLVFAFFLLWARRFLVWELAAWMVVVVAGSLLFWDNPPQRAGPVDVLLNPLTLEFISGCAIALLVRNKKFLPGLFPLMFGLVWLLGVGLADIHLNASFLASLKENWQRALFYGVPSAAIVYGMVCLEKSRGKVLLPSFEKLGDASYSLYLIHLFILSALVKLWPFCPWHQDTAKIIYLVLMAAISVACGFLVHHYLEKPLLDWTHALRGRLFPAKSKSGRTP